MVDDVDLDWVVVGVVVGIDEVLVVLCVVVVVECID